VRHTKIDAPRYHAFTVDELPDEASLPYLVQGMIPAGAIAEVHGAPGAGKSFVTVALALSVATGQPFLGHVTTPGPVLYVAAERFSGLRRRIKAWCTHHGAPDCLRLRVMQDTPQLVDRLSVRAFRAAVARLPERPVLIVLDTLSRSLIGADENGQRDMTRVVDSIDEIRRSSGATVLLVHHTRKAGDLERGSSVLRGAADLMISVRSTSDAIVLHADKVNDFKPFDDIRVRLTEVDNSCVVTEAPPASEADGTKKRRGQAKKARLALETLAEHPNGLTLTAWGRESGLPTATLGRLAKEHLAKDGLVTLGKGGKQYRLTEAGLASLS
jgi:RecA/RadA recombinase